MIILSAISYILFPLIAIFSGNYLPLIMLTLPLILTLVLCFNKETFFSYIEITDKGIGRKYNKKYSCYLKWEDIEEIKSYVDNEIVFIGKGQNVMDLYKNRYKSIIITTLIMNADKKLAKFHDFYAKKLTNLDKINQKSRNLILYGT